LQIFGSLAGFGFEAKWRQVFNLAILCLPCLLTDLSLRNVAQYDRLLPFDDNHIFLSIL